jgi:eukaryotic-like serine/threonine-protein kinase
MSLQIGQKVGSYEVTALLGKGGMGEVYRARDSRLKRDVAIKILPDEFTRDADRVNRFQREAEVLASLNHTNIAAIHDLQEVEGSRFLIMELVEGDTLADRIARGALPVDEALNIAKQICEGLEAAHEKGIIHRDLKPANVKILPDGKVKVLDFGLAKALEADAANPNLSHSPTMSMAATNAGVILGTAAYMSPEQARGRHADQRSDVFALGCVMYEMLSGKQAFQGEEISDVLASVLKDQPDLALLPANLNPGISELLRRCLDKNARRRWQAVGDVRIEIENVLANPAVEAGSIPISSTPHKSRERFAWLVAALFLIAVIALAIPTIAHLRETPPDAPRETRLDVATPSTADPISFALSPDGRQLVYVASTDGQTGLWVRPFDKTTAQFLPGTEGATYPFWSPDSRSIGFFDGAKLKRIDLAGGSPQTLTDAANRGGMWGLGGAILFTRSTGGPIFRVSATGGEATAVTKLEKQTSHRFPQFLPDGRHFLFLAQGSPETSGIYLGSLDSSETKRLVASESAGVYAPEGWLLFIRSGTLLAQHLDLAKQQLTGEVITVADPITYDSGVQAPAVSVSATNVITYRAGGGSGQRQLTWFDRSGKALGTLAAPDQNNLLAPRLSPDGRRVAAFRATQGNQDIWIIDADRLTRFTFDSSFDRFPIWSPDGSRIVFDSTRKGHRDLYSKLSNGGASEELLLESSQDKGAGDWSSDGRFIAVASADPQGAYDLWMLPMQGDRKPFVFLKTNYDERRPSFSPDGRWVAYMSNESGRFEIYVRPFPGPGGQWQISAAGGISPRWGPGGKELYYIAPDGTLMATPIRVNGATIEPGRPDALFHTRIVGGGTDLSVGVNYDIAPDGRILINTLLSDIAAPITILQNWKPPKP